MAFQAKLLSPYIFQSYETFQRVASILHDLFWDEYCFNYKQKTTVKG